jgi:predicted TPR repeat methyltransferase
MELAVEKPESIVISTHAHLLFMPEVTWTHQWLHYILNKIPIDMKTLIDVGCSRGIIGALARIYCNPERLVGIDIFKRYLDFCRKMNFYDELYEYDLRQTPLPFDESSSWPHV